MKVDFDKIERHTGLKFENVEQLYFYVLRQLEMLKANNKNYTKKQFYAIVELFEFVSSVRL